MSGSNNKERSVFFYNLKKNYEHIRNLLQEISRKISRKFFPLLIDETSSKCEINTTNEVIKTSLSQFLSNLKKYYENGKNLTQKILGKISSDVRQLFSEKSESNKKSNNALKKLSLDEFLSNLKKDYENGRSLTQKILGKISRGFRRLFFRKITHDYSFGRFPFVEEELPVVEEELPEFLRNPDKNPKEKEIKLLKTFIDYYLDNWERWEGRISFNKDKPLYMSQFELEILSKFIFSHLFPNIEKQDYLEFAKMLHFILSLKMILNYSPDHVAEISKIQDVQNPIEEALKSADALDPNQQTVLKHNYSLDPNQQENLKRDRLLFKTLKEFRKRNEDISPTRPRGP